MARRAYYSGEIERQRAMLAALSRDLALPLMQVKTSLEVMDSVGYSKKILRTQAQTMGLSVEAGLQLLEAYNLVLKPEAELMLSMEPFAVGSVLEEAAHQVSAYAKEYSTAVEVDVQGKLAPVLASRRNLLAALEVLGSSLIRTQAAQAKRKNYRIVLGAHKGQGGLIAAGVFGGAEGLSDQALRAARALTGQARQPIPVIPPGAASGILLADMLCANMWHPLRASAHRQLKGLATAIPATQQLQFV